MHQRQKAATLIAVMPVPKVAIPAAWSKDIAIVDIPTNPRKFALHSVQRPCLHYRAKENPLGKPEMYLPANSVREIPTRETYHK